MSIPTHRSSTVRRPSGPLSKLSRRMLVPAVAALGLLLIAAPGAKAEDIKLSTGEVITVKILDTTGDKIKFVHPLLGEVTLAKKDVTILPAAATTQTAAPKTAVAAPLVPGSGQAAVPPPAAPKEEPEFSFLTGWKKKAEAGITGSEGNSRSTSLRVYAQTVRATDDMTTKFDAGYTYASDAGVKSKSRAEANARNDWAFGTSPWGIFAEGKLEYDEFQTWKWRLSGHVGPSYNFIKTDDMLLKGRVGIGASKQFDGGENAITPEALLGGDFNYKITKRQSMFITADLLPSLSHLGDYRVDSKAGYQIDVDPEQNLYLKIGIADRYDSNPGGTAKRNDVDYFVALGVEF